MQSLASARDPSAGAVKPGSETAAGSPSQGGVQSDLVTIGDDSMFERVSGPVLHVDSEQAESRQQSAGSSSSGTSMHTHTNTQHTLDTNKSSTPSRQALSKAQVATDGGHNIDDRFRLPEDPKHVSEDDVGVVDLSPCPACSKLTSDEFCSTECERRGETDETPL